jgi:hypothetical protein
MTVRFLMDELRADDDGWPQPDDIIAVKDYIDLKRPVTVKDCYVMAPIKYFIEMTISNLAKDDEATRASIEQEIRDMLFVKAAPGQTIYRSWVDEAITNAESRERRGPADGKDRSPLDAAAASWQPPRAQAGCRDCGTHGNSFSPAPRSPRTSGDGPTERRATDSFPTTAPPIVSRAGSRASPTPAPS